MESVRLSNSSWVAANHTEEETSLLGPGSRGIRSCKAYMLRDAAETEDVVAVTPMRPPKRAKKQSAAALAKLKETESLLECGQALKKFSPKMLGDEAAHGGPAKCNLIGCLVHAS